MIQQYKLQKISFVVQKNIGVDDDLIDILNHLLLLNLKQDINYYNLEKHNEDLLLKDDLNEIIILFHI